MFRSPEPIKGIVMGTLVMMLLALPRTIANWNELTSGAYSSLWVIWPVICFGLTVMAVAAWRTWGRRRITVAAAEAPEAGQHSDREGH